MKKEARPGLGDCGRASIDKGIALWRLEPSLGGKAHALYFTIRTGAGVAKFSHPVTKFRRCSALSAKQRVVPRSPLPRWLATSAPLAHRAQGAPSGFPQQYPKAV